MADANDIADMGAGGRAALDAWLEMKSERDAVIAAMAKFEADLKIMLIDVDTYQTTAEARITALEVALRMPTAADDCRCKYCSLFRTEKKALLATAATGDGDRTEGASRPPRNSGRNMAEEPNVHVSAPDESDYTRAASDLKENPATLTRCTCGASDRTSHAIDCAAMEPGGFAQGVPW